ncbi:unnamed protein product [Orchesella dallaii]|uniref:Gustatory receptor n=1 Tax=Orchesella dallaii TaxID=48710 RepID=A0ABP1RSD6_9HEXA
MLTPLQKQAFILHKRLYGFLPDFPLGWDPEFKRLVCKTTILPYLTDAVLLVAAILSGMAGVYVIYSHSFIKPRKYFGFNQIFALIFWASFCFIIGIYAPLIMYRIDQWFAGFNNVFIMEERMRGKVAVNQNSKYTKYDILGYGACAMVCAMAVAAPIVSLLVIYERFDPFAYILDDILLADECNELSITIRILTTIFRTVLLLPILTELNRILTFLILTGMVFTINVMTCLKWLLEKAENVEDFLCYYLAYNIAYKFIEYVIPDANLVLLTASYWGLVGTIWICIEGFGLLDNWMYVTMVAVTVVAVIINWFALQDIKEGWEMSKGMLEKWKKKARVNHFSKRTKKSKIMVKRLNASAPLSIQYGPFFKMGRDFVMTFFNHLMQRELDMVLIIDV